MICMSEAILYFGKHLNISVVSMYVLSGCLANISTLTARPSTEGHHECYFKTVIENY